MSIFSIVCLFFYCSIGLLRAAVSGRGTPVRDKGNGQHGPRGDAGVPALPLPVLSMPLLSPSAHRRGAARQRSTQLLSDPFWASMGLTGSPTSNLSSITEFTALLITAALYTLLLFTFTRCRL